jgi:plastocyanin
VQSSHTAPAGPNRPPRHRALVRGLIAIAALAAMMVLAACGGAEAPGGEPGVEAPGGGALPEGGGEVVVEMTDQNRFVPEHVTVPVGGTITWRNTGSIPHTATDDPSLASDPANAVLPEGAEPWNSEMINGGAEFQHTFDVAGDYTYFCIPHEAAGMIGTITVE